MLPTQANVVLLSSPTAIRRFHELPDKSIGVVRERERVFEWEFSVSMGRTKSLSLAQ